MTYIFEGIKEKSAMKKRIGILILVLGGWLLPGSFADKRLAAVDEAALFKKADFRLFRGPRNLLLEHDGQSIVLPPGKLPWPHQRPGMTQAEYESFINKLWIYDNFGACHMYKAKNFINFHDGIDIMLPDRTLLYAVDSGWVKAAFGGGGYGIYIGDTPGIETPGYGWEYGHTEYFKVKAGDYVNQGDPVCEVALNQGHIHLSRVRVSSGSWKKENVEYLDPDKYFVYKDTIAPEVVTPFFYFKNDSDIPFDNGSPPSVFGDVDIVVPMRDHAEASLSGPYHYPWSVARIEYEISGEHIQPVTLKSIDFTKMVFAGWTGSFYYQSVFAFHKPHYLPIFGKRGLDYDTPEPNFHYYIITNTDGTGEFGTINVYDHCLLYQSYAWNTSALDEQGNRKFPDGLYTITVAAYDFKGNKTVAQDMVRVENVKKGKIQR